MTEKNGVNKSRAVCRGEVLGEEVNAGRNFSEV